MLRAPVLASLVVLPATLGLAGCALTSGAPARLEATGLSVAAGRAAALVIEASARPALPLPPATCAPTTTIARPAPAGTASDEPATAPEPVLDAELRVKRLVVAHGVRGREPVEPAARFVAAEDGRIYAFVEVANPARVPSLVRVSFVPPDGRTRGSIDLDVGAAPRWRTWAFTRLARQPGSWTVVVRDGLGKELARERFEVAAAGEVGA